VQLLKGEVAHYPWGSRDFLPRFLNVVPDGQPWAELWLGTHSAFPSRLPDGRALAEVAGELPFLVKVLSAAEPLSIQTHPDREQAEAGFAAEDASGVPLDAAERNYRDRNGKPELLWALTPVEALCGFRAPEATIDLLGELAVPALVPLERLLSSARSELDRAVLLDALRWTLEDAPSTAPGDVAAAAAAVVSATSPWQPEIGWLNRIGARYPQDRGLLAALLLNLVRLEPGAALVLRPGVPHAYLSGSGVEVMGASDNVLRGGLTSKHVDVSALVQVLQPEAEWSVQRPKSEAPGVESLSPHAEVFSVRIARPDQTKIEVGAGGATLALCVEGAVEVDGVALTRGAAGYADVAGQVAVSGSGAVVIVSRD
jgi:mannose-6-phosphate isomerase